MEDLHGNLAFTSRKIRTNPFHIYKVLVEKAWVEWGCAGGVQKDFRMVNIFPIIHFPIDSPLRIDPNIETKTFLFVPLIFLALWLQNFEFIRNGGK